MKISYYSEITDGELVVKFTPTNIVLSAGHESYAGATRGIVYLSYDEAQKVINLLSARMVLIDPLCTRTKDRVPNSKVDR